MSNIKKISIVNVKAIKFRKERAKLISQQNEYQKNLQREITQLINDIDNYDLSKLEASKNFSARYVKLLHLKKSIHELFERYTNYKYESRLIKEQIIKYIKSIIQYKNYARFIHSISGGSSPILELGNNINESIEL